MQSGEACQSRAAISDKKKAEIKSAFYLSGYLLLLKWLRQTHNCGGIPMLFIVIVPLDSQPVSCDPFGGCRIILSHLKIQMVMIYNSSKVLVMK